MSVRVLWETDFLKALDMQESHGERNLERIQGEGAGVGRRRLGLRWRVILVRGKTDGRRVG